MGIPFQSVWLFTIVSLIQGSQIDKDKKSKLAYKDDRYSIIKQPYELSEETLADFEQGG